MENRDTSELNQGGLVIAVASVGEGGLEARRSSHFGKSPNFTLVELANGEIEGVQVVANESHAESGCRGAAQLLASAKVNALVVGGIGARPLAILGEAGIDVYFDKQRKTVAEAVAALAAGELRPVELDQTCSHHRGQENEHSC
jgi:predicted Fe-Mo cluster-binding NifX family protein